MKWWYWLIIAILIIVGAVFFFASSTPKVEAEPGASAKSIAAAQRSASQSKKIF